MEETIKLSMKELERKKVIYANILEERDRESFLVRIVFDLFLIK